ncbi:hypothetical protein CQT46_16575 [Salmonella enterica]|nr:hypothetical protein [Salmonella enterica]
MKISITGITHDDNRVKGTASVEYDYLIAPVTMCSIPVSVEYVEGKSLEQYTRELKETALGIIRAMHDGLIDNSAGKASSAWSVKLNEEGHIATSNVPYPQIRAALPWMKAPEYTSNGEGLFDILRKEQIGGKVEVTLADGNTLTLEYVEGYNPDTTLAEYESRAKDYAMSVLKGLEKGATTAP